MDDIVASFYLFSEGHMNLSIKALGILEMQPKNFALFRSEISL